MKSLLKILPLLFATPLCFAQGVEHGNGGDEEVQFANITSQIDQWLTKNLSLGKLEEKLELKTLSGAALYASFKQATQTARVRFTENTVAINGKSRVCINTQRPREIVCNRTLWSKALGSNQYAIAFHEYLGIAGIENNKGDYSTYPVSQHLLNYVYSIQKYELGMEKRNAETPMIPTYNDLKMRFTNANHPLDLSNVPPLDLSEKIQSKDGLLCLYRDNKQNLFATDVRRFNDRIIFSPLMSINEIEQYTNLWCKEQDLNSDSCKSNLEYTIQTTSSISYRERLFYADSINTQNDNVLRVKYPGSKEEYLKQENDQTFLYRAGEDAFGNYKYYGVCYLP